MSSVSKSMARVSWCAGFLLCVFMAVGLIGPRELRSAPLQDIPVTVKQPDGEVLHLFASGDEFHNWLHDADHYTVVQDPVTGYYVYAVEGADGNVAPSTHQVGKVEPAAVGLKQGVNLSPPKIRGKVFPREDTTPKGSPLHPLLIHKAPQTGTINNLVVFIRFGDSPDFTHSLDYYATMFNSKAPGGNSMYNFYQEASYQKLVIDTAFYPTPSGTTILSYQDSHVRGYYQAFHASANPDGYKNTAARGTREHTLLVNAVNAVSSQVPPNLNIDGDNDGKVDNVCFIVQGEPMGWNSLLWPHMWSLYSYDVYINQKLVSTYNFQLETAMDASGVGVLAHEMFHSLGAPDLYHYNYDKEVSPAWKWDLMNSDLNPPQHMTAYMKMQYGKWIASIETISQSGRYTLKPLTSSENNAYRIASPNSSTEYFVLEYRKKTGTFENSLPDEGLLVYRINTNWSGKGNAKANYAGQIYDEIYVYRPGGNAEADGTPANATFSAGSNRTGMNDNTDPSGWLSDGSAGGLKISNVGAAGETISFDVELTSAARPDLKPYQPAGWPDEMVLSKKPGTLQNTATFLTSDTVYVDCAIVNDTAVAVTETFRMSLYVDGDPVWSWRVSSLSGNEHEKWRDLPLGELSAGEHQIQLVVDTLGTVEETSENDNTHTRTITVKKAGLPNLAPYQPADWSDKIVVSNVPGTHADTTLYSGDKLYVDWAVINKGPGDVTEEFTVVLFVDGVKRKTWTRTEGLAAGQSVSVIDAVLKPPEEGLHQIRIRVDREKAVTEGNDSDNQVTRYINIMEAPAL